MKPGIKLSIGHAALGTKGQLISKGLFCVFKSTKSAIFLPQPLKRGEIKKALLFEFFRLGQKFLKNLCFLGRFEDPKKFF